MSFEVEEGALRLTFEEIAQLTELLRGEVGTDEVLSRLAARDLVIRNGAAWTVDPVVAVLFEPFVDPQWALRVAVIGREESHVLTYCIRDDVTTRVIEEDGQRLLSALPTAELLVALRSDLPLPANDPEVPVGPEASAALLDEIAGLAVDGDLEDATTKLLAAGLLPEDAERYVAALVRPEHVITMWNGSRGLAWAIDFERRVWIAPLAESGRTAAVRFGEASTVDVLLGAASLLPGGPSWSHVLVPIREQSER